MDYCGSWQIFKHYFRTLWKCLWCSNIWKRCWIHISGRFFSGPKSGLISLFMLILISCWYWNIISAVTSWTLTVKAASNLVCSQLFRRIQLHFTIMTIIANSLLAWGSTSSHLSAWTSVRGGVMQVDAHALCSPTPQEVRGTCFLGGWRIPVGGGRWGQDVAWHC